mgnify:CR=1 FL=1
MHLSQTNDMKFLITGGAGFLGFHLIKRLLKDKHTVSVLDRNDIIESDLQKKVNFFKGDVRDSKLVDQAAKDQDFIIHAAASLPLEPAQQITTTTIQGTQNILESASKHHVKRTIYISSTAVYGIPDHHPLFETDPVQGVGPYGIAKIEAERLCNQAKSQGMVVPIIRPKTFIGTERLGVFQILFNWVRLGKRIPIIGDGNNRYQLLEVEDLVDAIMILSTSKSTKINDTFNIGAEKYQTVNQDVGALCTHAGNGSRVFPVPAIIAKPALRALDALHLSPLYKWVYETADKDSFVSIDKLKSTGWRPKRSNVQTLINTYDWYLKHYTEVENTVGTTHRVGWDQGVIGIIKKFM